MVGQNMTKEERGVFELMLALLAKHGKSLSKLYLKLILKWVAVKHANVTIFTIALWDDVGVKLYDLATTGKEQTMCMLPARTVIFETLKKEEQSLQILPEPCPDSPCPLETEDPDTKRHPQTSIPPLPSQGGEDILSHSP